MTKINIERLNINFKGISYEIIEIITSNLRYDLMNYSRNLQHLRTQNIPAKVSLINAGAIHVDNGISPAELSRKIANRILTTIQTDNVKEEK